MNHILRCIEVKEPKRRINRLNISIFLHSSIPYEQQSFHLGLFQPFDLQTYHNSPPRPWRNRVRLESSLAIFRIYPRNPKIFSHDRKKKKKKKRKERKKKKSSGRGLQVRKKRSVSRLATQSDSVPLRVRILLVPLSSLIPTSVQFCRSSPGAV